MFVSVHRFSSLQLRGEVGRWALGGGVARAGGSWYGGRLLVGLSGWGGAVARLFGFQRVLG